MVRERGIAEWGRLAALGRGLLLRAGALAVAVSAAVFVASGSAATGARSLAVKPAPVSWLTYGFDVARTGYNPDETVLGANNARRLHKEWSTDLGGAMIAQPVVAAGVKVHGKATNVLYEGTEHGGFYAIREGDGHVLWHQNFGSVTTSCNFFPHHLFGIGGAGAISFTSHGKGVVYLAGGDGAVHALDLATGTEKRGWPVRNVYNPKRLQVFGGLTLFKGRLYVTTASLCDDPPYHGGAIELSVPRHKVVDHFIPPDLRLAASRGAAFGVPAG